MEHFGCRSRRYSMSWSSIVTISILFVRIVFVTAQQECYFAAGASYRGPTNLVPCNNTGTSACCLLGDTCLSGSTCYNYATGDLYQYGCTDITYQDPSCPRKCEWDPDKSPWTALEYCTDVQDLADTWVCHAPESCDCDWNPTYSLQVLKPIGCKEMGVNARVALYAPSTLAPYVSLPSTIGGSTGYYSPLIISGTSTWVSTAIAGYTPTPFTQLTTYRAAPTTIVLINGGSIAAASTSSPTSSTNPTSSMPAAAQGSTAGAASTASATAASGSSSSTPSSTASSTPSSGLSTGAKAGIGVGAAAVVCIIGLLVFLLFKARKSRRELQSRQSGQMQEQYDQTPTLTHYSQSSSVPYYSQSPPMGHYSGVPTQDPHWSPYPLQVDAMGQPIKPPYPPGASPPPAELAADRQTSILEIGSESDAISPPASPPIHGHK